MGSPPGVLAPAGPLSGGSESSGQHPGGWLRQWLVIPPVGFGAGKPRHRPGPEFYGTATGCQGIPRTDQPQIYIWGLLFRCFAGLVLRHHRLRRGGSSFPLSVAGTERSPALPAPPGGDPSPGFLPLCTGSGRLPASLSLSSRIVLEPIDTQERDLPMGVCYGQNNLILRLLRTKNRRNERNMGRAIPATGRRMV